MSTKDLKKSIPLTGTGRFYEEVKKIIGNQKLNRSNIVVILLSLMQSVENYKNLSGIQKKTLILDTLNNVINDIVDDEQEAMELKLLVQLTLPSVIDTFISIDKKKIVIKIKKGCKSIFSCCKE